MSCLFMITIALAQAIAASSAGGPQAGPQGSGAEAAADDRVAALEKKIEEMQLVYEARIAALESDVAALRGAQAAAAPAAAAPAPPPAGPAEAPPITAAAPAAGTPSQSSNYFNPSISVIGNFLGVGGHNDNENLPSADLRESEVGIQAVVDPYARADFFLSFGESGVDVEEGIVTFTAIPWGLLAKVGRMRVSFGKINTLHLHVLPWPDEPLPVENLLGGDEGWIGTGVSVAKLIPMGDVASELTLQAFGGDAGDLFEAPQRDDYSFNAHYKVFADLTESTNLEFGLSYGIGPNGITDRSDTSLDGADMTWRWKPLRKATYRSASLRGELIRSRHEDPVSTETAGGWFFSGEYQLAKRWFAGARYEFSEHADDASMHDSGTAALLTFWPSEFSQLRSEFRRRYFADGEVGNEILLQIQFAIGAHGAHPF